MTEAGCEAYGVDVSEPSIARAKKFCPRCAVYDGKRLPFDDNFFDSAGALNVLEHVDEPEAFIQEIVRVVAPGGKVVISSQNFMRAAGFRDYHPKMRGLGNKWRNWRRIQEKRAQMKRDPANVKIRPHGAHRETAIRTRRRRHHRHQRRGNRFLSGRFGCRIEEISCTDRYVPKPLDFALNATPLRDYMFSGFVVARKS